MSIQVTLSAWDALCADAERNRVSIASMLNNILHAHYRIPKSKIPTPKRTGRKPKK